MEVAAGESQPTYQDEVELQEVLASLRRLPPLVTSWEVDRFKPCLAKSTRARDGCSKVATAPSRLTIANRVDRQQAEGAVANESSAHFWQRSADRAHRSHCWPVR